MSILDDLPGELAEAMADVFHDAVLKLPGEQITDGQGGFTAGPGPQYPCKALVDDYSDYRRAAVGIPATDRKIILLGHGLPVTPQAGQTITAESRDWQVIAVSRDPAGATYELQAR